MKSRDQILEFLGINTSYKSTNLVIKSLSLDSRKCKDNSAFIAIKGILTDGNNYIDSALAKGVKLVLSDNKNISSLYSDSSNVFYVENLKNKLSNLAQWFYDYKKPYKIIGVTGTNGKTSISTYIAQLQSLIGQKSLLLGTNGNGIYPNLKESTHTTLDILSLYETIGYYTNYQNLVMEVSSHALDQGRIKGLDFDIAIFSNISHDHLDYHHTMENYFEAKAKLFKLKSLKKAVVNIDDKYGLKICDICKCKITTVSLKSKEADFYLETKSIDNMQTIFDLYINQKYIGTYHTYLVGDFNLMNLGLSLAALDDNDTREKLLENICKIKPIKGRMEVILLSNKAKVIIDYAHTPDALEKALQTLSSYKLHNLWCVFGCGGSRDTTKRPKMAKIAEKYADKIIITEDNNRFENIENIFADIKKGFSNPQSHIFINSREEAIKYVIKNSQPNDIILLAGKGHECYLDKNGQKEYFDEREVIQKYS